jgi:L-lactate dehydrogenase complex protein LldE
MTVRLMLTCLCDAFFGEVGIATVRVLEHLGCKVEFDSRQTCCGQPPFNAGDWNAARKIAEHCKATLFPDQVAVVTPSGSCAAMLREGYPMLFPEEPHLAAFELGEFIVHELGISTWPGQKPYPRKIAFHRACHGRALGISTEQESLIASVPGVELVPFAQSEQCCGFGGAFAATHGKLSQGIGMEKLRVLIESGAEEVVSGDMGCLMHLKGLIEREKIGLKVRHFAEVLSETLA